MSLSSCLRLLLGCNISTSFYASGLHGVSITACCLILRLALWSCVFTVVIMMTREAGWLCCSQDKKAVDIPKTSNTTAPQKAGYIMEYEHGQIRNGTVAIVGKTCASSRPVMAQSTMSSGAAGALDACAPCMQCNHLACMAAAPHVQKFSLQSGNVHMCAVSMLFLFFFLPTVCESPCNIMIIVLEECA